MLLGVIQHVRWDSLFPQTTTFCKALALQYLDLCCGKSGSLWDLKSFLTCQRSYQPFNIIRGIPNRKNGQSTCGIYMTAYMYIVYAYGAHTWHRCVLTSALFFQKHSWCQHICPGFALVTVTTCKNSFWVMGQNEYILGFVFGIFNTIWKMPHWESPNGESINIVVTSLHAKLGFMLGVGIYHKGVCIFLTIWKLPTIR